MQNKSLCAGLLLVTAIISHALISAAAPLTEPTPSRSANESLLQAAAKALTAGKLRDAEDALQAVLLSSPKECRALDLLGVVRVLQQRQVEADELFRRAIQNNPEFAPAHAHLGLLDVQQSRPDEAVSQLHEALRLDPGRSDASGALVHILRNQAQVAATAGDSEKALALLIDARKYAPDNPDVQFEFGTIAMQMSLWQDAIEAFQRVLKERKNDRLAIYNLGRAFMGLSKFEDAREQFARYVEERPNDPSGYCALGMTLAALEHAGEARTQFERSIALSPAQTESYFRLGLLDLDAKELDSAAKNLRQVLDREPKHAAALTALGRVEFEQKRYSEATDLLEKALSIDDSLREAHYYLGLALARLGRKRESDEQLQIATNLEHDEASHRRVFRILDPEVGNESSLQPEK